MMLFGNGFYIAWHASLHAIHKSQKAILANSNINKNKLVEFVFSKSDLKKNIHFSFDDDDENEFEFDGRMYDIVSQQTIGDSIHISTISDKEEDNLRDVAMCQILQGEKNTTGRDLPVFKIRLDHFTNDFKKTAFGFFPGNNLQEFIKHKSPKLTCPYYDISAPPPRFMIYSSQVNDAA